MTIYLRRENIRRDAASGNKLPEQYTEAERVAEREMGDNASFFRYTVWLKHRALVWSGLATVLYDEAWAALWKALIQQLLYGIKLGEIDKFFFRYAVYDDREAE